MVSVHEALKIISANVVTLQSVPIPLDEALGATLSTEILSPIDMPPFSQSAMDGYALGSTKPSKHTVIAEIQAGQNATKISLKPTQAARIFTGAMVPRKTAAIAKQEIVLREGDQIMLTEACSDGANIRNRGEQILKGATALPSGTTLNPAAIGFLAMLGIEEVEVHRKPRIALLVTGDELVAPGHPLKPGKIYESNGITVSSALHAMRLEVDLYRVSDSFEETKNKLQASIQWYDLVLTTGGISVGDYDFVGKALTDIGVKEQFYKIAQKPGKPLYYGTTSNCQVFALPGNPASVLTCFYLYVVPAIQKMLGKSDLGLKTLTLPLQGTYAKTPTMTHFLKGKILADSVEILSDQSSAMLSSFAHADCLIHFDADTESWASGDQVTVTLLPH